MKRILWVLLAALLLTLCACGAEPASETEETTLPVNEWGEVVVSDVDQLLAALGSGVSIRLLPGEYDLTSAATYGRTPQGAGYSWEARADGYQLVLNKLEDLRLLGSGMEETSLVTASRYAQVLELRDCTDVSLEDFTAGHTPEPGVCTGSVLRAEGCTGLVVDRLGLYGCGVNGLVAENCDSLRLTDSDLYDCSGTGVSLWDCRQVTLEDLRLRGIGEETYGGFAIFSLTACRQVEIRDCQARDSRVQYLVQGNGSEELRLETCEFENNQVTDSAFDLYLSILTMEDCGFSGNRIRSWYPTHGIQALDKAGDPLSEELLEQRYGSRDSGAARQQTVYAATVDELLGALGPKREVILTGESYDLGTASDYLGFQGGDYYSWEEGPDGLCLVIWGLENLTLRSQEGDPAACRITAQAEDADTLFFLRSSGITLSGLTLAHSRGSGGGDALNFQDCDGIRVEDCVLEISGGYGLSAARCGNAAVTGCTIQSCGQGGIRLERVITAELEECIFRELTGPEVTALDCQDVTRDGTEILLQEEW